MMDRLLSAREVADRLGISNREAYRVMHDMKNVHRLPVFTRGRLIRVREADLDKFVTLNSEPAPLSPWERMKTVG